MKKENNLYKLLSFIINRKGFLEKPSSNFYQEFISESEKSVERVDYLLQESIGKRVLHFGFLDSPFLEEKTENKSLLHTKLLETTEFLFGLDINNEDLLKYRNKTGDYNNEILDIEANLIISDFLKNRFDLILFTEVLEHVSNAGITIDNLYKISKLNNDCRVIITVPNAYSMKGFLNSIYGIESVHADHIAYYSPYTIKNLLSRSGFKHVEVFFYASRDLMQSPGITKNGIVAVCQP